MGIDDVLSAPARTYYKTKSQLGRMGSSTAKAGRKASKALKKTGRAASKSFDRGTDKVGSFKLRKSGRKLSSSVRGDYNGKFDFGL